MENIKINIQDLEREKMEYQVLLKKLKRINLERNKLDEEYSFIENLITKKLNGIIFLEEHLNESLPF